MVISSMTPFFMEISILMVGEMLAMFPPSKASGVGMGLMNQLISLHGIKSLVLTAYMGCWLGGVKDSCEKKSALWCMRIPWVVGSG
jgi:hypothetical protein